MEVLVFRAGEERLALELSAVAEVVHRPACTPIPGSPPQLAGLIHVRGRIRPVWDLARLLGSERSGAPGAALLLRSGNRALLVDAVAGIERLRADDCRHPEGGPRHVKAVTPELLTVLDAEHLFDEESL
jgi:chemotaxis signal transduction protein